MHSPFVYNLLTKCLYRKEKSPGLKTISAYIKAIRQDERKIKVTDFGAGSRVFKSYERKISDIAKNAGISKKRAILLNKLTSYLDINTALELGTSVGISSAAIAAGNNLHLTTLEGCPETATVAREYFRKFGLENISIEVGEFDNLIGKWKVERGKWTEDRGQRTVGRGKSEAKDLNTSLPAPIWVQASNSKFQIAKPEQQTSTYNLQPTTDLIYFDGNHQKEATLKYFHQLLPLAHNDSVFIFDDIHWSKGMEEAWEEIKAHPRVRVTIDSFFWGIVFFREEQEKEHFVIRL